MIGINGMGRIGRNFFRVLYQNNKLAQLSAINDIMPKKHLAYLLQYDTVRGKLPSKIHLTEKGIAIDGHEISVSQEEQPKDIPWKAAGVNIAVESTGVFTNKDHLDQHITAGAQHAILTTTGTDDIPLYILGVNEADFKNEAVFSIGSCTVNGSAPLLKAMELFDPTSIYINVIHAYSARQNILDSYYPEIRRSRASADNIIPLNINLDLSLQRLFPHLNEKIKSITSRVPIPCGVLADFTVIFNNPPKNADTLNEALSKAGIAERIMALTHDPLVSSDTLNDSHSLTIDGEFTHVMKNHAKLLIWFDNEWGFSNRLMDWVNRLTD